MALPVFKTGEARSSRVWRVRFPSASATSRAPAEPAGGLAPLGQAARRRTSQTVAAMSSTDSASSQPPSIHWKAQNRLPG